MSMPDGQLDQSAHGSSSSSCESADYRTQLVHAELASQTAFDRTLLALSGGALGLSVTFVDRIVGPGATHMEWLWTSWILWASSLAAMLVSHYVSTLAMRSAILKIDQGVAPGESAGGVYDWLVRVLNPAGGVLFLVGVATMVVFVIINGGQYG